MMTNTGNHSPSTFRAVFAARALGLGALGLCGLGLGALAPAAAQQPEARTSSVALAPASQIEDVALCPVSEVHEFDRENNGDYSIGFQYSVIDGPGNGSLHIGQRGFVYTPNGVGYENIMTQPILDRYEQTVLSLRRALRDARRVVIRWNTVTGEVRSIAVPATLGCES